MLVVNCFWIVSLKYWAQHLCLSLPESLCCELLLNCIFEILSTTRCHGCACCIQLWIAFELYLWNIEHNPWFIFTFMYIVVNCFWIVSLKYWAQLWKCCYLCQCSCELLLNCIFEILSTTSYECAKLRKQLWIAFELYLWNIEHN